MVHFNGVYVQVYDPQFLAFMTNGIQTMERYLRRLELDRNQDTLEYFGYESLIQVARLQLQLGTEPYTIYSYFQSVILTQTYNCILRDCVGITFPLM